MIDSSPERPVPNTEHGIRSSVEDKFRETRDKFGSLTIRLKDTLTSLRQGNIQINFDAEIRDFDEQVKMLDVLNKSTRNNLDLSTSDSQGETGIKGPSPLTPEVFHQREEQVLQLVKGRTRETDSGLFRDRYSGIEYQQEQIQKQLKNRTIINRLKRYYLSSSLQRGGVQDPEKVISFLEHNIIIHDYGQLRQGDLGRILKHLDPASETNAVAKLETAFKRLNTLHLLPTVGDFKVPAFADILLKVNTIPEEQMQRVYDELDPYQFLYGNSHVTGDKDIETEVKQLMEVIEQGGLTDRQKEVLEKEAAYSQLTRTMPVNSTFGGKTYPGLLFFSEAINPVGDRLDEFWPFVVDATSKRIDSQRDKDTRNIVFYHFLDGLEGLRKNGSLTLLKQFIDAGWNCEGIYEMLNNSSRSEEVSDLVRVQLANASEFAHNKDRVTVATNYENLLTGESNLNITKIATYEALMQDEELAKQVVTFLSALPSGYKGVVTTGPYGERIGSRGDLYQDLTSRLNRIVWDGTIPDHNKQFALIVSSILRNTLTRKGNYSAALIKKGDLALFSYIASNTELQKGMSGSDYKPDTGVVEQILKSDIPTNNDILSGLVELCSQPRLLSPEVAWKNIGLFQDQKVSSIVSAFPDQFITTLSSKDQAFIYIAKHLSNMVGWLRNNREILDSYVVDGKPTVSFFELAVQNKALISIDRLLTDEILTTFTSDQRSFWQTCKDFPVPAIGLLLSSRDRFNEFLVDGQPTPLFFTELAKDQATLNSIYKFTRTEDFLKNFSGTEKIFWKYFVQAEPQLHTFLLATKDTFSELYVDGKETPAFYATFAKLDPQTFIQIATKDQWKLAFGDEQITNFLNILPEQTDEKRNAFTHNEYDRTTQFINYLLQNNTEEFSLSPQGLKVATEYVKQFGFSRTPILFHYFRNLYLYEQGVIPKLPKDIEKSKLRSTIEMTNQLKRIKDTVYSEIAMTNLSRLSDFEVQMLKFITGKSTHRFDSGRLPLEEIIKEFQSDMSAKRIEGLPSDYHVEILDASNIRIEFNAEAIKEDYEILRDEILVSIEKPEDVDQLKELVKDTLKKKIDDIARIGEGSEVADKKQEFMARESSRLEAYITQLNTVKDLNNLMKSLLEMNFDKTEQKVVSSIFRRIIFSKVFQKQSSPGFVQDVQYHLQGGISASGIESVINIVDEMAKTHALNLDGDNSEGYWDNETFKIIKGSKRGRDLPNSFSPHIGKLREEVQKFKKIQTGTKNQVKAIPDRGFVGEMSGYLADVCYTAEYPLLKKYPNVIPFKFIRTNPETGEPYFIGSVLVFEVTDSEDKPSLLIRGFDVPNESSIDIDEFIEQFIDKLSVVGKQRKKKQILVPGNSSAISNYHMTINHMRHNYVEGQTPISLSENFSFNQYNLTKDTYVARKIASQ